MGYLSQVAEVISLHLQVEDFALRINGVGDQKFVKQVLQVKMCNISVEMCATRHITEVAVISQVEKKHIIDSSIWNM